MSRFSSKNRRIRATEKPGVINGHLKIASSTTLLKKHTFDDVSTFLLPEVIEKIYFQALPAVKF